ncbi:MAG: nucleotidyltransferase [Halothermotrichaceae bacterium]
MNILGIITEYNPFHYGHLYHLKKAREVSQSDAVICIMNGNFMQRGLPAILNKWARAEMAVKNGVDIVIELPLVYGIRSAEYFAYGAVSLLQSTNITDFLVFGSEVGQTRPLIEIAEILLKEAPYLKQRLKHYLNLGQPFPKARELSIKDYLTIKDKQYNINKNDLLAIIGEPNNILGIEYIKALLKLKSKIKPLTITRKGSNYHEQILEKGKIASATAIREQIISNGLESVNQFLPESTKNILDKKNKTIPPQLDNLGLMILSRLRKLTAEDLLKFAEIDNGIENRITETSRKTGTLAGLIDKIKTKAFTRTRIQRNLLHILFNIKKNDFELLDKYGCQYLRVLAIGKNGAKILSKLNKKADIPVIVNPSEQLSDIKPASKNPLIKSLSYDIMASDIYTLLSPDTKSRKARLDFIKPIIKHP